jgi:uncharacterized repeat protein (TIGR03803 family)
MKTSIEKSLLLPVLFACLSLLLAGPAKAQTFKVLHTFSGTDGSYPWSGVILSGNTLFGTTVDGGSGIDGTVFALNTDGSGFTNLFDFPQPSFGFQPYAGLVLSGGTLYGATRSGGDNGLGTVFAVGTDGSGATPLCSFTSDGYGLEGSLGLSDNILYGTAAGGGASGYGTVFAINTDGSGFTTLYSFTAISTDGSGTNADGAIPRSGLLLSGNVLYGTADGGGIYGRGTIFVINTDGTGFANLYYFKAGTTNVSGAYTNSDGAGPNGLILSGNTFYGTTQGGGTGGSGTVFAINTDGSGFTNLHSFAAFDYTYGTNSDGTIPDGLVLSGNTLYGTALYGGATDSGTVFKINTDGTGFKTLYRFTATSGPNGANSDGAYPDGLVVSGNTLYGTAQRGGRYGGGTVFSLSLPVTPPQLSLTPSGPNVVLTWPTNATGFTLQSTTNLGSSALWTTNTPPAVVVNDQNVVTNPITGTKQFFRLGQ